MIDVERRWAAAAAGRPACVSCSRKSSKLMCPQPPLSRVDQPDHDLPAQVAGQVDDDTLEVLAIVARGPEDDLAGVLPDQLDARRRARAARRPGSWRTASIPGTGTDVKRPLGRVAALLVGADPEPALRAGCACRPAAG